MISNLVEVTIKYLSFEIDSILIEADVHRRRPLLCHDIDFVLTLLYALCALISPGKLSLALIKISGGPSRS